MPGLNDYPDPRNNDWDWVKTTPYSNRHEMLTGTQPDGRAFAEDLDYTCNNWTNPRDRSSERWG